MNPFAEPRAVLSRKGVERLQHGHPWVYRSDVATVPRAESGDVVALVDQRGRFQGKAFWSERSQIAIRLLTRDEEPIDEEFFARRIASAVALRRVAFGEETLWRAVHGESDLLPGLVADRYGDVGVIQTLVPGTDRRKELLAGILARELGLRAVLERNDVRVRELEGLVQVKGPLLGADPGPVEVQEGRVRLRLDLLAGQKTGSFLDQRENHVRAGEYARGRALDCFSYAGGFALQMAARADEVVAVEMQSQAAAQLRENAALNRAANVRVEEANAFDFLRDESEKGRTWDTVVLDPPAFAKNKASVDAARRGYKEVNLRALQCLRPGGVLVTASCSYHVSAEAFEDLVRDAASDAGRALQLLERRGAGRDHPERLGMPESRYLKCLVLRVP
ncbi:MAG: class I SAM-dependent rRNA methyltransferase [Anaeromyxobacteraceae bacterium]